jgi:mevalonate kinase
VGLSLSAALRVRLFPEKADRWRIEGVEAEDRSWILKVLGLVEELAFSDTGSRPDRGRLALESQIPRGLGFGSSASLCVAVASLLASQLGRDDPRRIWEWAHRAEALFHGTPSGIDTGLALLGGLYSFRPHPPRLPEAERLVGFPLHLVVGAVPREASAGTLIGALRQKVSAKDQGVEAILERLGGLAGKATAILGSGRQDGAEDLGALAAEAQGILRAIDLSTPALEALLQEGRARGALGGKLSGAGGGGAFFLICPDRRSAQLAAAALKVASSSLRLPTTDTIYPLSWLPEPSP